MEAYTTEHMHVFRSWRHKKFHSSYGLGWLCLGIVGGLYGSQFFVWNIPIILIVVSIVIAILCIAKLYWYSVAFVIVAGGVLGIARGGMYANSLAPLASFSGKSMQFHGRIAEDPSITARGDMRMIVSSIMIDGKLYPGTIWVSTPSESRISRDDQVMVSGKAKSGFGVHQLSMSYASIAVVERTRDPLLRLRDQFGEAVRRVVVEPAASLGLGFVVGQKSALPPTLDEQLRIVGLTHLIVASGYNLTILVRLAKRLFEKHSKYAVASSSTALIAGFIVISGASPSMVRAGLVAGLSLLVWYYGRRFHPLLLIGYVAALTGIWQPSYVWADIGWWLSFLAFFGVLIVSPVVLRLFMKPTHTQPPVLLQITIESLAAQIMTLPFILLVFGKLSVVALVANVVTAPFIPLAMSVTFIAGITTMAVPVLGGFAGIVAEIILSYFVAIVRWLSSPSWAQIDVAISAPVMMGIYGIILVSVVILTRKTHYNFRSQSMIE